MKIFVRDEFGGIGLIMLAHIEDFEVVRMETGIELMIILIDVFSTFLLLNVFIFAYIFFVTKFNHQNFSKINRTSLNYINS